MADRSAAETRRPPDWVLLGATTALVAIGLMMVYSSTYPMGYRLAGDGSVYFRRQLMLLGIGVAAMVVTINIDYRHWMKVSIPIMAGALITLIALVVMGGRRLLVGESVSPAEVAKLALVIYIAHWLASKRVEQLRKLPVGLLPFTIIVGVVAGLVMAQPDYSEAIVIVLVGLCMFFLAGADLKQVVVGIAGGVAAFVLVIRKMPTALERLGPYLTSWRDPLQSSNEQLRQGVIALGSGGLFGLGPGNGRMSHRWLPAAHTDSIFAIVGEELGMLGCLILIVLFAVLAYRGLQIARRAPDLFGRYLSIGVTCWITVQALINMAVVTGTIPFAGIALPFISVGGTALVTCLIGVGILLSVSRAGSTQGVASNEVDSLGRRDGRTRVPGPGRNPSPA